MASQRMIFFVIFFLMGYVSAQQCKVDHDCDKQSVFCTNQRVEQKVFCFEGKCYCAPWPVRTCSTDKECTQSRTNDCGKFKSVCTHGRCLCSKSHKKN
ncbi:hypothetical protein ACP275_12G089400 [Erythranthe tilingii]